MKFNIKEVKKYFKEQGCKLLEEKYINAHIKMKYICSCGNESSINWNNFKSGKRCGCKRKDIQKLTKEEIKKELEEKGCEFISSEYNGLCHFIECKCKCGNLRKCKLSNFRKSSRCRKCLHKDLALNLDLVKNYFYENGCELLEKEYKNARNKLKYKCCCGQISKICFYSFKNGNRCDKCGNRKVSAWMSKNRRGEKNPRWIKDREVKRHNDAFCEKCRCMVRRTLKLFNKNKTKKTECILGYKFIDLKRHLEGHKNWNKIKNEKWHIDHIFPLKAFVEYDILDPTLANCLENLQPMIGKENISKSCKYDKFSFEYWLESKGISIERRKIHREI